MSKRKLDNVLDTNNDTFKRSKSLNSKYIGKNLNVNIILLHHQHHL